MLYFGTAIAYGKKRVLIGLQGMDFRQAQQILQAYGPFLETLILNKGYAILWERPAGTEMVPELGPGISD